MILSRACVVAGLCRRALALTLLLRNLAAAAVLVADLPLLRTVLIRWSLRLIRLVLDIAFHILQTTLELHNGLAEALAQGWESVSKNQQSEDEKDDPLVSRDTGDEGNLRR